MLQTSLLSLSGSDVIQELAVDGKLCVIFHLVLHIV